MEVKFPFRKAFPWGAVSLYTPRIVLVFYLEPWGHSESGLCCSFRPVFLVCNAVGGEEQSLCTLTRLGLLSPFHWGDTRAYLATVSGAEGHSTDFQGFALPFVPLIELTINQSSVQGQGTCAHLWMSLLPGARVFLPDAAPESWIGWGNTSRHACPLLPSEPCFLKFNLIPDTFTESPKLSHTFRILGPEIFIIVSKYKYWMPFQKHTWFHSWSFSEIKFTQFSRLSH